MPALQNRRLLVIDAWVNLLLGAIILAFPFGLNDFLGLPQVSNYFYTSLLGVIILGIGVALLIEVKQGGGLGLLGAIAINICGGGVLLFWLTLGCLPELTNTGQFILWFICILVLGIGVFELVSQPWNQREE